MNAISASIVPCYPTLPAAALSDCLAGQPEIFILAVLAKAGLLLFLPFIHVLPAILPYIFYEHSYFQTIAVFPCRPPPHPISARYGKNQQNMATFVPIPLAIGITKAFRNEENEAYAPFY